MRSQLTSIMMSIRTWSSKMNHGKFQDSRIVDRNASLKAAAIHVMGSSLIRHIYGLNRASITIWYTKMRTTRLREEDDVIIESLRKEIEEEKEKSQTASRDLLDLESYFED